MSREAIQVEGTVIETLLNAVVRVELANGHRVLGHWPSHRRRGLEPGARVTLEMSPYDFSRGRIVFAEE